MNLICPGCGDDVESFLEGYCSLCHYDRQEELDNHNNEYDYWQSFIDSHKDPQTYWKFHDYD
jgi:hypothetical protein